MRVVMLLVSIVVIVDSSNFACTYIYIVVITSLIGTKLEKIIGSLVNWPKERYFFVKSISRKFREIYFTKKVSS